MDDPTPQSHPPTQQQQSSTPHRQHFPQPETHQQHLSQASSANPPKSIPKKQSVLLNQTKKVPKDENMYCFRYGDKILNEKKKISYEMLEILGQGTFGQVILCRSSQGYRMAMKVFRKQPAYINQGLLEVKILREISKVEKMTQGGNKQNYLNLYDAFMWQGYLCVVMEVMDNSLLEILLSSNFRGLEMKWIETWTKQLIFFLAKIHALGIYHCDIKPQNIMFRPEKPNKPVLIDFSSACTPNFQPFTYIQSRYYRAPEVLIGLKPYTQKIDIWSLGCSLAEIYLGLPLFPGGCAYDQLQKICKLIKYQNFSGEKLKSSQFGQKYFIVEGEGEDQHICLKKVEEVKENEGIIQINEDYYKLESIGEILTERNYSPKEMQVHELFVDLIKKMLVFDPEERISAEEAYLHPFVGGIFSELEQLRQIQELQLKAKIS